MRKFVIFLTIALVIAGSGALLRPDLSSAYWQRLSGKIKLQVASEMATLDQLMRGELKLSPAATLNKALPPTSQVSLPVKRETMPASKKTPAANKAEGNRDVSPVNAASPTRRTPPQEIAKQLPAAATGIPETSAEAPEQQLGNILKHEERENQVKEETFWTEERIQEAIKNGEPSSSNSACILFCDKKNTIKEINTPPN